MIILFVFLSFISFFLLLWQISNLISVFFGCPYVKTGHDVIRKALKLADIKKGDVFYDLGCGNGDVLIKASKMGAKCIGFEISPYYYIIGKIRIRIYLFFARAKNKDISIEFRNIQNVNLQDADVIYCYLVPKFLNKLSTKFKRELKPSARLISIGFPIVGLKLSKKIIYKSRAIFIYL